MINNRAISDTSLIDRMYSQCEGNIENTMEQLRSDYEQMLEENSLYEEGRQRGQIGWAILAVAVGVALFSLGKWTGWINEQCFPIFDLDPKLKGTIARWLLLVILICVYMIWRSTYCVRLLLTPKKVDKLYETARSSYRAMEQEGFREKIRQCVSRGEDYVFDGENPIGCQCQQFRASLDQRNVHARSIAVIACVVGSVLLLGAMIGTMLIDLKTASTLESSYDSYMTFASLTIFVYIGFLMVSTIIVYSASKFNKGAVYVLRILLPLIFIALSYPIFGKYEYMPFPAFVFLAVAMFLAIALFDMPNGRDDISRGAVIYMIVRWVLVAGVLVFMSRMDTTVNRAGLRTFLMFVIPMCIKAAWTFHVGVLESMLVVFEGRLRRLADSLSWLALLIVCVSILSPNWVEVDLGAIYTALQLSGIVCGISIVATQIGAVRSV